MNAPSRFLFGEYLIHAGALSSDQLRIALVEQRRAHQPLGRLLVRLGFITEDTLRHTLSAHLGQNGIDPGHTRPDGEALALLSKDEARKLQVLPLRVDRKQRTLTVACAKAGDYRHLAKIAASLPEALEIEALLSSEGEIERAIDFHYGYALNIEHFVDELENPEQTRSGNDERQPAVGLIDALLIDATRRGVSDIHFEPEAGFLRIRYRIDGVLRQISALHQCCWPSLSVRLKVLAGMNIAETRTPQDGRFSQEIDGRPIDFRAASQPTLHGENIVLRLLDRHKGIVPLSALGLNATLHHELERMLARPEGLILVTGPTGSGKTTTLYSLLQHIDNEGIHIMTLEDPVEYPLPRLRQTSINENLRLDFASGIRAMMRQDPDVILVGEIRDTETAAMAFRAAMTGHQVYATLHANSALGAIPRLLDIGVSPEVLAGNLVGIVAQRLLRRLCVHCRLGQRTSDAERRLFADDEAALPETLYCAQGCSACDHTGYSGRLLLMEVLRIDETLDALLARRADAASLRSQAYQQGYRPLCRDGLRRVAAGETSLDELRRVVDLSAWM